MDNQILNNYSLPEKIVNPNTNNTDNTAPYSFQNWLASHIGVIPGDEYQQYNNYLADWYINKNEQSPSNTNQIKLNYLNLLSQLQLFIPNQQLEEWYNQVNILDERELLLTIPYYAKKLRDIALFYSELRKKVKNAKTQYSLVGTNTSVTQQLLNEILATYSQRPNNTVSVPASVWSTIPQLSAIHETINIQVEELYDFQTYLGRDPRVKVKDYIDLAEPTTVQYFSKLLNINDNILPNWIYNSGNIGISKTDNPLATYLEEKYLGESKYTAFAANSAVKSADIFNTQISAGDNFFYWPNSPYLEVAFKNPVYDSIPLEESGINDFATAGLTLEEADTIFIKTPVSVEGAWYRYQPIEKSNETMIMNIEAASNTVFRFPFPGYGLSGENIDWSGPNLSTTPLFPFLPEEYKSSVEQEYWNFNSLLTCTTPIKINETTLVNNNAYSSLYYVAADKIKVWSTPPDYSASSYNKEIQEAWLYQMKQTDIPIKGYQNSTGSLFAQSVVVWPYERIDSTTGYPDYLPPDILTVCAPELLSDLYIPGATASTDIATADTIYKLNNYDDPIDQATECAWLSGAIFYTPTLSTASQPGFNAYIEAGKNLKFVWTGPNVSLKEVFINVNHERDCKYVTNNFTYTDNDMCTCRSVLFTPFGHPGKNYYDNNGLADFIAIDTAPDEHFELATWMGSDENTYTNSKDFAWYQTDKNIGWGNGKWVNNSTSNIFTLSAGQTYIYGRANAKSTSLNQYALPDLVIRFSFVQPFCNWVKAVKDSYNNWVNADEPTDMIIRPGEILLFQKANHSTYTAFNTFTADSNFAVNTNSIWSNFDLVTIGSDNKIHVRYPPEVYTDVDALNMYDYYGQYPVVNRNDIARFEQWSVEDPFGQILYFHNQSTIEFIPNDSGIYYISLTAAVKNHDPANPDDLYYYFITTIPPISAVDPVTFVTTVTSYSIPAPGYVLNTPLQGWSYSANALDPYYSDYYHSGARPFWGKSYTKKTKETDYKNVPNWGSVHRFFDNYNCVLQPHISTITLSGGERIEYQRNYNVPMTWIQPIVLESTVNKKYWSKLEFDTTAISNLSGVVDNIITTLVATPLTASSEILLKNYINNQPVEVYYNSSSSFTWPITTTYTAAEVLPFIPVVNSSIHAKYPWGNLHNRFYPTFAISPYLGSLSGVKDVGGYFTPNNLGISYFLDRQYTTTIKNAIDTNVSNFENPSIHVGGRGLTQRDQLTPYTITLEDNSWIKEPFTSGDAAGNIKKSVAKTYQKFIPYQSSIETSTTLQAGLITTDTILEPWIGPKDTIWGDARDKSSILTDVHDIDNWPSTQIISQTGKDLDNWCTDIFGNQYGLYKELSGVEPYNRKNTTGNIWVKTSLQTVAPASKALSSAFQMYKSTFFYDLLINKGVTKIDVFFDTLYVETTGAVLFKKLTYDYNLDLINSLISDSRYISLAVPTIPSLQREVSAGNITNFNNTYTNFAQTGDTWFFPDRKQVIVSNNILLSSIPTFELYGYNIKNAAFGKIFPTLEEDITIFKELSSLEITSLSPPALSYSDNLKEYVVSSLASDTDMQNYYIIELVIPDTNTLKLKTVNVYRPDKN